MIGNASTQTPRPVRLTTSSVAVQSPKVVGQIEHGTIPRARANPRPRVTRARKLNSGAGTVTHGSGLGSSGKDSSGVTRTIAPMSRDSAGPHIWVRYPARLRMQTTHPWCQAGSQAWRAHRASRRPQPLPLRGDSALPVKGLENCPDIILVSFFDSMGTAALALRSLGLRLRASVEWEIDPCVLAVSSGACSCLRFKRGDLLADNPEEVARLLQGMLAEHQSLIVVTAGPPCPDYSRVHASAQGREGGSGQLFVKFAEFLSRLEDIMPPSLWKMLCYRVRRTSSGSTRRCWPTR